MKRADVKRSMLCGVLATVLIGIPMAASADFSGPYAPINWTITHVPDNATDFGSVDTTGAPGSVAITGSNSAGANIGGPFSRIEYTTQAAFAGNVIFDWNYESFDDDSQYDPAGYIHSGTTLVQLTNSPGAISQSGGPVSFAVSLGETFGFYVETTDNGFGPAILTIDNFCGPEREFECTTSVPEPASLALMALGLLGMGLVRRRRTR